MLFLKNFHYCLPYPFPWMWFRKRDSMNITMDVKFDDSIVYDLGEDQMDVNKLLGFAYGFHHINSDRIGFRYNIDMKKVELVYYLYVDGVRQKTRHLCYIDIGVNYEVNLNVCLPEDGVRDVKISVKNLDKNDFVDIYNKEARIEFKKKPWYYYILGGYFGGNRRAPHTIRIKTKKTITLCRKLQ